MGFVIDNHNFPHVLDIIGSPMTLNVLVVCDPRSDDCSYMRQACIAFTVNIHEFQQLFQDVVGFFTRDHLNVIVVVVVVVEIIVFIAYKPTC